jgi:UDP-2,4-diacetamido-2,4,6-trideoxy-beta-L-altropyranose hydrolase
MGTGQLMRCLVLAHQARLRGVSIEFLCTDLPGHLGAMAIQQGFTLRMLGADTGNQWMADFDWERDASLTSSLAGESPWDWLVVDHYGIDWRWEVAMRPATRQILVIDDLANRVHDCDVLVDQNYYLELSSRYDKLVPFGCRKLLGPRFLLLRPEFKETKLSLHRQIGNVKRILISFGGTDETNVTCMSLRKLKIRISKQCFKIPSELRMFGYLNAPSLFDAECLNDIKDAVDFKDGYYKVTGRISYEPFVLA